MYVNWCANHHDVCLKKHCSETCKICLYKTEKYRDCFCNMRKTLGHLNCMFSNKL